MNSAEVAFTSIGNSSSKEETTKAGATRGSAARCAEGLALPINVSYLGGLRPNWERRHSLPVSFGAGRKSTAFPQIGRQSR